MLVNAHDVITTVPDSSGRIHPTHIPSFSDKATMQTPHRAQILARYRELLQLLKRLPADRAAAGRAEAQATIRQRMQESDPEAQLQHLKEMVAKISFLRITTPRRAGEPLRGGSYVLRDGELTEGAGEDKGSRVADGSISMQEAQRLNRAHYKRFYGRERPKEMFF